MTPRDRTMAPRRKRVSARITPTTRIEDLLTLMQRMEALYKQLVGLIRDKLDRMKKADLSAIAEIDRRAEQVTRQIDEQNGLRRQLMERIGKSFGIDPATARSLTAGKLAERVAEPIRTKLQDRALSLRIAILETQRANKITQNVTQDVLRHLRVVFDAFTTTDAPTGEYTDNGRSAKPKHRELFEVIG